MPRKKKTARKPRRTGLKYSAPVKQAMQTAAREVLRKEVRAGRFPDIRATLSGDETFVIRNATTGEEMFRGPVWAVKGRPFEFTNSDEANLPPVAGAPGKTVSLESVAAPGAADVLSTLAERHKSYGTFKSNAALAQTLKNAWRAAIKADVDMLTQMIDSDAAEAIDQIMSKVSRLVIGDTNHVDGWRDIEGYARLVRERIEGRAL